MFSYILNHFMVTGVRACNLCIPTYSRKYTPERSKYLSIYCIKLYLKTARMNQPLPQSTTNNTNLCTHNSSLNFKKKSAHFKKNPWKTPQLFNTNKDILNSLSLQKAFLHSACLHTAKQGNWYLLNWSHKGIEKVITKATFQFNLSV